MRLSDILINVGLKMWTQLLVNGPGSDRGCKEPGFQLEVPKLIFTKTMSPACMTELCTSISTFTLPNLKQSPMDPDDAHPASSNTFQTWGSRFNAVNSAFNGLPADTAHRASSCEQDTHIRHVRGSGAVRDVRRSFQNK